MAFFKIEDNVPLPLAKEALRDNLARNEEPVFTGSVTEFEKFLEEPSRWKPFKARSGRKCANDDHVPMIGTCRKCGDIFPCPSGECGHFDCANPELVGLECEGNGTETPEFLSVIEPTDLMARAEFGAIEIQEIGSDETDVLAPTLVEQGPESESISGILPCTESGDACGVDPESDSKSIGDAGQDPEAGS